MTGPEPAAPRGRSGLAAIVGVVLGAALGAVGLRVFPDPLLAAVALALSAGAVLPPLALSSSARYVLPVGLGAFVGAVALAASDPVVLFAGTPIVVGALLAPPLGDRNARMAALVLAATWAVAAAGLFLGEATGPERLRRDVLLTGANLAVSIEALAVAGLADAHARHAGWSRWSARRREPDG